MSNDADSGATIYPNYPHGLSRAALQKAIQAYAEQINKSGANINTVLQLSPYLLIGSTELQARENRKVAGVSMVLGAAALLVSLFAAWSAWSSSQSATRTTNALIEELRATSSESTAVGREAIEALRAIGRPLPATVGTGR